MGKRMDARIVRHTAKLAGLTVLFVSLLASCQVVGLLFGVTIAQRVQDFSTGYTDGEYASLYRDFASANQNKRTIKTSAYWEGTPFASANDPKPLAGYNIEGSTVTGTFMNNNGTYDLTMEMAKIGIDWYIKSITLSRKFGPDDARAEVSHIR